MSITLNFYYPCIEDGGLEKNLFSLINSLAEKNYQINFFTYENKINDKNFKNKFYFHKKINILEAKIIPGIKHRYIKYLFCSLSLFLFSIFKNCTIVSFQGNILPIIVSKVIRKKIIIRCNTAPSKYIDSNIKKFLFSFFYSKSNIILVTCNDFKKEIKKYFGLESIVHRQSLDVRNIKKKSKSKFKFKFFNKFYGLKLINIGRLTAQKDQITLLKAFAKLVKYRKAKLLLLGSGSDKNILKNFISTNKLKSLIKIISYTPNPFKYISKSDIKILSSKYEGSPNILLETACLKKLIISSNCKVGPRETLQAGKGGILFKVGNFEQLFQILKKIKLDTKDIKNKINVSYNYVTKNFDSDISETFIKILKKL